MQSSDVKWLSKDEGREHASSVLKNAEEQGWILLLKTVLYDGR